MNNPDVKVLYEDEQVRITEHVAANLIFFEEGEMTVSITPEAFEKAFDAWN